MKKCVVAALLVAAGMAGAQDIGTRVTYQGELRDAAGVASGMYDLRFRLYTEATSGSQVGAELCADDVVVEGGRFSVGLDFGQVFDGQRRYLAIEVRPDAGAGCSDGGGFVLLAGRQELTPGPHAVFAARSATAGVAGTASNALLLGGQNSAFYLNAGNLTGVLADARLSGNVPRLNGNNAFTGVTTLSNASNVINGQFSGQFSGNGALLTGLDGANILAGTVTRQRLSGELTAALQGIESRSTIDSPEWISWGANGDGQATIPALPPGVTFVSISGGDTHTLGLRSDGQVMAWGTNHHGQSNVPALPPGVTYTKVHAGNDISLAMRSDGQVVSWGLVSSLPFLPNGVTYTSEFGSGLHYAALLRSDGTVVVTGGNAAQVAGIPALPPGVVYTRLHCGWIFILAERSDGQLVAWGSNVLGSLDLPTLPPGVSRTDISVDVYGGAILRSDGQVSVWGPYLAMPPALPEGLQYTQIDVGGVALASLRSDGVGFITGVDNYGQGQTNLPALPSGTAYASIELGGSHAFAQRGQTRSYRGDVRGVAVGAAAAPSVGGLSVAGASRFESSLAAASFSGSGAGLTDLSAAGILTGTLANARTTGTASSTANTLVLRDASGNFSAGTITASLNGNATTATNSINAVNAVNATSANNANALGGFSSSFFVNASNLSAGTLANERTTGTALTSANTLVLRDASGNFGAGTITANLNGNATSATNSTTLGGQPPAFFTNASNLTTGTLANARTTGTALSTPNTLVVRDASGNFAAGTITAALTGNATSATNATNLNGQPASFYTNADNLSSGILADARLSINVPRLNAVNAFTGTSNSFTKLGVGTSTPMVDLDVNGRINVTSGTIQRGGSPITTVTDLGLYSQTSGNWIRFVTNSAQFAWFADSGPGTVARMTLSPTGNLSVSGLVSKGGGSFKIDHPLDPENQYLYHSFVESPDMKNIYDGVVVTDGAGFATVTLPDYFEALNRDYRYQLTVVGDQGDEFVQAKVAREVEKNEFVIRTSRGGTKVSWMITGIRHDAFANKNRIPSAVPKQGAERGTLLHPDAFGRPESMRTPAVEMP